MAIAAQDINTRTIADEEMAARSQWKELLGSFRGEYVAMYEGRVVAHGPSDEVVAAQVMHDRGDVPFYIVWVHESAWIADVPSPELVA